MLEPLIGSFEWKFKWPPNEAEAVETVGITTNSWDPSKRMLVSELRWRRGNKEEVITRGHYFWNHQDECIECVTVNPRMGVVTVFKVTDKGSGEFAYSLVKSSTKMRQFNSDRTVVVKGDEMKVTTIRKDSDGNPLPGTVNTLKRVNASN